jgi:hypothetical protein
MKLRVCARHCAVHGWLSDAAVCLSACLVACGGALFCVPLWLRRAASKCFVGRKASVIVPAALCHTCTHAPATIMRVPRWRCSRLRTQPHAQQRWESGVCVAAASVLWQRQHLPAHPACCNSSWHVIYELSTRMHRCLHGTVAVWWVRRAQHEQQVCRCDSKPRAQAMGESASAGCVGTVSAMRVLRSACATHSTAVVRAFCAAVSACPGSASDAHSLAATVAACMAARAHTCPASRACLSCEPGRLHRRRLQLCGLAHLGRACSVFPYACAKPAHASSYCQLKQAQQGLI